MTLGARRRTARNPTSRSRFRAGLGRGAHAILTADRLLARARGFYRYYFKKLVVVSP